MSEIVGIGERMRLARSHFSITQVEMAARLNVSLRALQSWESEERGPKAKDVAGLADMGVDLNWLLTGDGEMRRGAASAPTPTPAPTSPVNTDLLRDCIQVLREELQRLHRTLTPAQEAEAITLLYEMAQPEPGQDARPIDRGVVVRLLRVAG